MKKCPLILFALILVFGITSTSYADRRNYVWTYEYQTMPKGMYSIEYWLTQKIPHTNQSNINSWEHQLELEYGITNNWDVALYQMLKHERTDVKTTTKYDGFKIETRYRFGEKGQFFVDPLLYFEYERDPDFSKPNVAEVKLILAKDIGNFNISYNQIMERNLEKGKTEPEYAVGISYAFSPVLKLGMESKGSYSEREYAIGPTLAWANSKFWVSLGVVFGLNERTDDVQSRMIVGIPF